jgi:hypothetical protein
MTTVWRVAADPAIHESVRELAQKETRSVSNMLKVLLGEALFARQIAQSKHNAANHNNLVAAIRGRQQ